MICPRPALRRRFAFALNPTLFAPPRFFPIVDDDASKAFADGMMKEVNPSVIIAIERCGWTDDGMYRNMRGRDITPHNARIDHIFSGSTPSVGVGDGGNEIGMGNLAEEVPKIETLVRLPCVTTVDKLILASVSNWGGYLTSNQKLC